MALPDVRHIMQRSLAHIGHMGARIPEAQVKVSLLALPSPSWVVGLGVGRALPQTQGLFDTKALRLDGWAPHQA